MRVDLRNTAVFVRDSRAAVTNVMQPLTVRCGVGQGLGGLGLGRLAERVGFIWLAPR